MKNLKTFNQINENEGSKQDSPFDSLNDVYGDVVNLYTLMDGGTIEWMKATDLDDINDNIENEGSMDKFDSLEDVDKWIDTTLDKMEAFVKIARAARAKK